jgi:uncharacterized FAD-dependent dehydrogenase
VSRVVELALSVHPDQADDAGLCLEAARALGIDASRISAVRPLKRGVDARRGRIRIDYQLAVGVDGPLPPPTLQVPDLPTLSGEPAVVVVGAGPAGLMAAWTLAHHGVRCVLIERGADVRGRRPAIARLNREGVLDAENNYCFGEGGAGTFSDGKLYTRATGRGPVQDFMELLVACGAPASILYEARPHIGTNRLPGVVQALRERLIAAGVDVRFNTRVDDLHLVGTRLAGVVLSSGDIVPARAVIIATGHSARDIYHLLHRRQVALAAKPFALGVRIEHPQAHIDAIQYGALAGHPNLGAAPYTLKRTVDAVGCYSFCMCPGGFIVAAATGPAEVVVNGMSPSKRDSHFANSGMVATAGPETFGEGPLAGLAWQAAVEQAAFAAGGGLFRAPAQRLTDFLAGKISADLPVCSYRPGLTSVDVRPLLPEPVKTHLPDALRWFEQNRMRGYVTREAVVVGVESRSSSPVRILRDSETLQSPTHPGLYPCGEGAGFAGGIVSAALDGAKVAQAIVHAGVGA